MVPQVRLIYLIIFIQSSEIFRFTHMNTIHTET